MRSSAAPREQRPPNKQTCVSKKTGCGCLLRGLEAAAAQKGTEVETGKWHMFFQGFFRVKVAAFWFISVCTQRVSRCDCDTVTNSTEDPVVVSNRDSYSFYGRQLGALVSDPQPLQQIAVIRR